MEQHVLEENSFMRVQDEATQTYSEGGESLKNNEEENLHISFLPKSPSNYEDIITTPMTMESTLNMWVFLL